MPRDNHRKRRVRFELTPEEKAAVIFYMKVQMEQEQQQVISRRAAEAAREAKFRALEESHREALRNLEEAAKKRKEEMAHAQRIVEAMKEGELARLDAEIARRNAARRVEEIRQEKVNAEMRELSAVKGAKMAILCHAEYKKMTQKAQAFVQKLGNDPREVLERLCEGDAFRLKMEKECRALV
jgi:hypothetical protein